MATVTILALTAASFAGTLYAVFSDEGAQPTVAERKAAPIDGGGHHGAEHMSEKAEYYVHTQAGHAGATKRHVHQRARVHPAAQ